MVRPIPKARVLLRWPDNLMQYTTVYIPNSAHSNQITPSTAMTVSLAASHQSCLPLLIRWRLLSGPYANLGAFWSPTRPLFSPRSQAQQPKKTQPASLCMLLLTQACLNMIRSHWLLNRRSGPSRRSCSRRICRNALAIVVSTTASLVDVSYPNSALISFAVYHRVYISESEGEEKDVL